MFSEDPLKMLYVNRMEIKHVDTYMRHMKDTFLCQGHSSEPTFSITPKPGILSLCDDLTKNSSPVTEYYKNHEAKRNTFISIAHL